MKCYYCGASLDFTDTCPECNADVRVWKKINSMSNRLYNDGLEKAKVRNLSGAADSLKVSLRYNKMNIDARNLLGLVYYEMGETVNALSEWVISKSLAPDIWEMYRRAPLSWRIRTRLLKSLISL